jgi:hypothetical protein
MYPKGKDLVEVPPFPPDLVDIALSGFLLLIFLKKEIK